MPNLTPWQNNNNNSGGGDNGTANSLMSAAKKRSIVSTAEPINGFQKRTKEQNKRYAEDLKQRREQTRLFAQYCKMNLLWQKEDVKSTKVLTQWRTYTFRNLTASGLIVARGSAQQQVIAARAEQQFSKLQSATDQKIQDLKQQAESMANDRGWR